MRDRAAAGRPNDLDRHLGRRLSPRRARASESRSGLRAPATRGRYPIRNRHAAHGHRACSPFNRADVSGRSPASSRRSFERERRKPPETSKPSLRPRRGPAVLCSRCGRSSHREFGVAELRRARDVSNRDFGRAVRRASQLASRPDAGDGRRCSREMDLLLE